MILTIPSGDLETYLGFIDESRDHLDSIEQKVLGLKASEDPDTVNSLFRALHTIKGIAGFLGLSDIQRLSHRLESVFDAIRQSTLSVEDGLVHIALGNLDHLMQMMSHLESGIANRVQSAGGDYTVVMGDVDYASNYEELGKYLDGTANAGPGVIQEFVAHEQAPGIPETEEAEEDLVTPEMRISFVKESEELLDSTEQVFLRLEGAPGDGEAIAQAFRNIHSFKGNCGFFGFADLEKLSHRLENVLENVRASGDAVPVPILETSLQCLDLFRTAVGRLGSEADAAIPDLAGWLSRLDILEGKSISPIATAKPLGEILVQEKQVTTDELDFALSLQKRPLGQILIEEGLATPAAVDHALNVQAHIAKPGQPAPPNTAKASPKDVKRDIRVDLGKLDLLMDLVGELVISTGMVFNHPSIRDSNAPDLEKIAHQLKGVVTDLQGVALGVRMVPIEGTFRKMTRLVHDLSSKVGKKVRLDFKGEATEVDKTVVDLIADPLVHMIRNSVDHGLEETAERSSVGKDPMGVVTLEAGQEGGEILIIVRDDGRGMSREKILRKAMERGLVKDGGEGLSDSEVFQFIFQPGFSTAEAVTATSGRGVGMDVVKSNIDKLGGRISIVSSLGKGSAITLRIPLTLSIIDGMMVQVGESLFILPLTAVRESISPRRQDLFQLAGGQEMLKLRGKALPILRLGDLYGLAGIRTSTHEGLLIHVEARDASFCLAVDNLLGQRQVVVKSLPEFMANVPGTSSCSILDNGEIALILDVSGLDALPDKVDARRPKVLKPEVRMEVAA